MLYGIMLGVHTIVCLLLIIIVLIQSGRGGGLAESFTGAESIFGTKTNTFLTRTTTFLAIFFFITCLSLAILSKERSKSLVAGKRLLPTSVKNAGPEEKQPQPPIKNEGAPEVQTKGETKTIPDLPKTDTPETTQPNAATQAK